MSAAVMPYQQNQNQNQTPGAPPGSITGIGPSSLNGPYGGPGGPQSGGPSGPYFGPPPKDKGPSLGEVVSDNLSVSVAKVAGGSHKAVDIAIIKATTAKFSVVPKEKHVRTLKHAVHGGQPGSYAGYVIDKLQKRLRDAKHWLCALKTLMVFHRLMRESEGASFVAELLRFSGHGHGRGYVLNMDSFTDSGTEGKWDYSEWVRVYARYLDEQLEVYSKTAFYQEPDGSAPAESKMRNLPPAELLAQLPPLQKLLERLMDCLPRGVAARHFVVQASLLTIAKESFQIYRAISEGIINLADCFFDMEYTDAQRGLDIYKQHTLDNDKLGAYYAQAEQIEELKRSATFPKLTPPSPDFLGMMEEYVQQAPRGSVTAGRSTPLRKGQNVEEKVDDLPPAVDSGLSGVIHPEEKQEEVAEEPPPPTPPAPEPEMDLLNFDDPDEPAAAPPPPREKTATELLEEEQAAAAASGVPNGTGQQPQFAPQQPPSNNPFGEGAAFGAQQQPQQDGERQPGSLHLGAVVPYGQNTYGGGPGWGAPYGQQQYGYGQQQFGYGQHGYGYGGGYGGAPIQPGQMVPYGLQSPGYGIHGSPGFGQQAGAPSPAGSFPSPSPYATTPGGNPSQSFKEAALNDPFADLGNVRATQPTAPQTTPPLREVSPTQQRINLGLRQSGQGGFPQQGGYPQQQQQQPQQQAQQGQWQQQAGGQHPGQPQANGWGQQNGGFASFPASPGQGPPQQQWGQ